MKQRWREESALIEPTLRTMRLLVTPVPLAMAGDARELILKRLCEEISVSRADFCFQKAAIGTDEPIMSQFMSPSDLHRLASNIFYVKLN